MFLTKKSEEIERRVDACLLTRVLFSHKWLAFFYGIFLFLYELKFFRVWVADLHPVLIAWAGGIVVYDVLIRKIWKKIPYWQWIVLFAIFATVTVVLNLETGLVTNVKSWVMVLLPLCAFYPACILERKEDRTKSVLFTMSGAAVVIFLASAISLTMFLLRYSGVVTLGGVKDFLGILFLDLEGYALNLILFGVYTDSNHAAAYSLLFTAYSIMLFYACSKKLYSRKWQNVLGCVFAGLNIVVQLCFFPLANSRGSWLSLFVASFIVVFLYLYFRRLRNSKFLLRMAISLMSSVLCVAILYGGLTGLRTGISQFSHWLTTERGTHSEKPHSQQKPNSDNDETPDGEKDPDMEQLPSDLPSDSFEKYEDGTGSGRLIIWDDAFELFAIKPLFGTGPGNNQYYAQKYNVAQNKIINGTDVHNSFLSLLVEYGVLGTIPVLIFWILCLVFVLKQIIKGKKECSAFYYVSAFVVLFISGISALLSCIFVSTTAIYFSMLIVTGYLVANQESDK